MLARLISGNDTPFVFEKAGTYYSHFMIDEFQDTSAMQWENFLPLLRNATAQSETTPVMLVGDVKQSIYRWRGGDWSILARRAEEAFDHVVKTSLREKSPQPQRSGTFYQRSRIGLCTVGERPDRCTARRCTRSRPYRDRTAGRAPRNRGRSLRRCRAGAGRAQYRRLRDRHLLRHREGDDRPPGSGDSGTAAGTRLRSGGHCYSRAAQLGGDTHRIHAARTQAHPSGVALPIRRHHTGRAGHRSLPPS